MRAISVTVLLLCAACAPRHHDELDEVEVERPERFAAEPSIDPGVTPPPTQPPPGAGHASVSEVRVFAETTPGIYEMALDATHLYWVTDGIFGPSAVWRAHRDTAQTEQLAISAERVYSLAIDETHVYFVETTDAPGNPGTGSVLRVPKSGGAAETIVVAADNPTSVAVDETHVYFSHAFSPDGSVHRAPKAGGASEVVIASVDNPWDFAVDGTYLYVSEMNRGRMLRAPKSGGDVDSLASGWLATGWMAIGGDSVYFNTCFVGSCAPSTLRALPRAGGEPTVVHESPHSTGKIAYGQGYVVWGDWFVPLDGSAATSLSAALAEDVSVTGVAGDERAVFVADHPSGTILTATVSLE